MLREKNAAGFRRISWEDALNRIAARMRASDPKRIAFFLTSRGVTNEVYYMAQKVARFLGTNNVDNAARLCHSPSTAAMKHAIGVGRHHVQLQGLVWDGSGHFLWRESGQRPARRDEVPARSQATRAPKWSWSIRIENREWNVTGCRRRSGSAVFGTDIADYWFPVSTGGDIAFLYGVLKIMFENGWQDEEFIRDHTKLG